MGKNKRTLKNSCEWRYEIVDQMAKWGDDNIIASDWYPTYEAAEAAMKAEGLEETYSNKEEYSVRLRAKAQ